MENRDFLNNDNNINNVDKWFKTPMNQRQKLKRNTIKLWKQSLPIYKTVSSTTLMKRNGPFLVSLDLQPSSYHYHPNFSFHALWESEGDFTDTRTMCFRKSLQAPYFFQQQEFLNDTFSGRLSYFSLEKTFEEANQEFIKQVPLLSKKVYTLDELNAWFEYCIQNEFESLRPHLMKEHIIFLRYYQMEKEEVVKQVEEICIVEGIGRWLLKRFFLNSLRKTDGSFERTMFRELLKEQINAFSDGEVYEFDMETDGMLEIIPEENILKCIFTKENTKNIKKEYAYIEKQFYYSKLEKMVLKYLSMYFCIPSEKKKFLDLLEVAKEQL